jgi:hypothetical protein
MKTEIRNINAAAMKQIEGMSFTNPNYKKILFTADNVKDATPKDETIIVSFGLNSNIQSFEIKGMKGESTYADVKPADMPNWEPVFNSSKKQIKYYIKPPFLISLISLSETTSELNDMLLDDIMQTIKKMPMYDRAFYKKLELEALEKYITDAQKESLTRKEKELKKLKSDNENMTKIMAQNEHTSKGLETDLIHMKKAITPAKDVIKSVLGLKDVEAIHAEGNTITITTKPLTCTVTEETGRKWTMPVGHFDIIWDGRLRLNNLDKKAGYEYDYPHVNRNGPCMGNMEGMVRFFQTADLDVAVMSVIEFLTQMTNKSAFIDANEWVKGWKA